MSNRSSTLYVVIQYFGWQSTTVVSWDNCEYYNRTGNSGIGVYDEILLVTSAKAFKRIKMPPNGLIANMYRDNVLLTLKDPMHAPGIRFDDIERQITYSFIATANREVFLRETAEVFEVEPTSGKKQPAWRQVKEWPHMPCMDRLAPRRTEHVTLFPVTGNESTTNGTHNAVTKMFGGRFGLTPEDHIGKIRVCVEDEWTSSNINGAKRDFADEEDVSDREEWLFAIPGLFYLCMAIMDQIYAVLWGDGADHERDTQNCGLRSHAARLYHRNVPHTASRHSHLEFLHSQLSTL